MNAAESGAVLALFDIDGTLVREPSTEKRFALWMLLNGKVGPLRLLAYVAFCLRYGPRFGAGVFAANKSLMWRRTVDEAKALAGEWAAQRLRDVLYAPCVERLELHKRRGDIVVLLSGTPDFLAEAVAEQLQAPHVMATRCAERTQRFILAPPELHCVGTAKLKAAHELCERFGTSLNSTVAYANSITDLPLLAACGSPVAVMPDAALAAEAQRKGWETMGMTAGARIRASA